MKLWDTLFTAHRASNIAPIATTWVRQYRGGVLIEFAGTKSRNPNFRSVLDLMRSKKVLDDINLVVQINRHIVENPNNREAVEDLLVRPSSFQVLANLDELDTPVHPRHLFQHQSTNGNRKGPCELPFHLQGDATFAIGIAVQKRRVLQHSSDIRTHINSLWDVACNETVLCEAGSIESKNGQQLSQSQYMKFMLLVYKALRFDFQIKSATEDILCDWEIDSSSSTFLNVDQFHASIFELVDLWTCDIEEATYTAFLKLLINRITVRVVVYINGQKLVYSVTDNFSNEELIVKAIPLQLIDCFAPVVTLSTRKGVNTVGELAATDASELEIERQAYVAQMNFSAEKLGKDISHLLDMFKCLSKQFQPNAYKAKELSRNSEFEADNPDCNLKELENQNSFLSGVESHTSAVVKGNKKSTPQKSSPIYDLTRLDLRLVDSIRASFIIENDISLEYKCAPNDINIELRKFGVNPDTLAPQEASAQYHNFYEMLVVKNGQDIKALAKTVLDQIRFELASHGIYLEESQLEGAYDEFYSSIVKGNGQKMVQDAKDWIDKTKRDKTVSSYIKSEYTTLRNIDSVDSGGFESEDIEKFIMQSVQPELTLLTEASQVVRINDTESSVTAQEENEDHVEMLFESGSAIVEAHHEESSQSESNTFEGIIGIEESASIEFKILPDADKTIEASNRFEMDTGTNIYSTLDRFHASDRTPSLNVENSVHTMQRFVAFSTEADENEYEQAGSTIPITSFKTMKNLASPLPIVDTSDRKDDKVELLLPIIQPTRPPPETKNSVLLDDQSDKTDNKMTSQCISMPILILKSDQNLHPSTYDNALPIVSNSTEKEPITIPIFPVSTRSYLPDVGSPCPTEMPPKIPQIVVGGIEGASNVATISRYIRLLELGTGKSLLVDSLWEGFIIIVQFLMQNMKKKCCNFWQQLKAKKRTWYGSRRL